MTILYGIKNCGTVKKAMDWLKANGVEYRFHDFRANGLDAELLGQLETALGWEALLNRRGTSWRNLKDEQRDNLDRDKAIALMLTQPSLIKRPVLVNDSKILIVFTPEYYQAEL